MDVSGDFPGGMEHSGLGIVRRVEPQKPSDSGHQHFTVSHAMQITDSFPVFHRVVREVVVDIPEFVPVGIPQHGNTSAKCAYPQLAFIVLLYGIDIIGTQGRQSCRIVAKFPDGIAAGFACQPHETVSFGPKPDVGVLILENGVYHPEISCYPAA